MMKQQTVYNLEDFATKYHLDDIFGAYAAHFSVTIDDGGGHREDGWGAGVIDFQCQSLGLSAEGDNRHDSW